MTPQHNLTPMGLTLAALVGLAALGAAPARAALIFDDENAVAASHQVPSSGVPNANNGVGATITLANATPITNFSLLTFQQTAGDLKFIVYDQTTNTFLYTSAPVNFGADVIDSGGAEFTFKESPTFNLTLSRTDTYDLGAIADDDHYYAYDYVNSSPGDTATHTENGITGPPQNILFQNFTSPTTNGTRRHGGVRASDLQRSGLRRAGAVPGGYSGPDRPGPRRPDAARPQAPRLRKLLRAGKRAPSDSQLTNRKRRNDMKLSHPAGSTLAVLAALGLAARPPRPPRPSSMTAAPRTAASGDNITGAFTVADHFTFTGPTTVNSVRFWEADLPNEPDTSAIQWTFYADSGGSPGAVLFSGTDPASAVTRTPTAAPRSWATPRSDRLLRHGSVTFTSPGTYWLGLYEPTNSGFAQYWETSNGNPAYPADSQNKNVKTTGATFQDTGDHQAFQLFGTPADVTPPPSAPEPSTLAPFALAALGLGGLTLRARKRRWPA